MAWMAVAACPQISASSPLGGAFPAPPSGWQPLIAAAVSSGKTNTRRIDFIGFPMLQINAPPEGGARFGDDRRRRSQRHYFRLSTIHCTAARTSASVSAGLPPRAGIIPAWPVKPLLA